MSDALESQKEQLKLALVELNGLRDCYMELMTENMELKQQCEELRAENDRLKKEGRVS